MADATTPRWHLPDADLQALARVFATDPATVARVAIHPRSWFCRLHGRWVSATTRVDRVYVRGSGPAFAADPDLVVHEFFHVLRQWNPGRLTAWRYVLENATNGDGYQGNRFEIEARAFAGAHAREFARLRQAGTQGPG